MTLEVEHTHFCVGDADSLDVVDGDKLGSDGETGSGRCSANEIESFVDIGEGLARPVSADLAEQAMFDGIPLGSAGRVVADGDFEAE